MSETHTELRRWGTDNFPLDTDDDLEMGIAQEVLPRGHWLAFDYSADEQVAIVLLRNDEATHD